MARMLRRVAGLATIVAAASSVLCGTAMASSPTPVSCSLYASPAGSDSGSGSLQSPFLTAQKLVDSLAPGQTGCLRGGTYSQPQLRFDHGGSPGAPITLASYPGETATLSGGYVYVVNGSDHVTLTDLHIDATASTQVGVQVMAADTSLIGDDITNSNEAHPCVILGSNVGWGAASGTLIEDDVIHQCGSPADGNKDHAIYFDNSTDATVTNNVIWGAAAFAIHLYQNAQGNQITHNVMVDNGYGVIFAGSDQYSSDNNLVADNVIADSSAGYDVESWWGGAVGSGNIAENNCVYGGASGTISDPTTGFVAAGNVTADPMFVNEAAHDYRLASTSPCLSVVGYDTAAQLSGAAGLPGTPTPPTGTGTSTTTPSAPTTTSTTTPSAPTSPTTTTSTTATTSTLAPAPTPSPAPTTGPTAAPQAPTAPPLNVAVSTGAVSGLTSSAAVLGGRLSGSSVALRLVFAYGTTTSYGHLTPSQSVKSGSVSYRLTGLKAGQTYHYRLVAVLAGGAIRYGSDMHFTTPASSARARASRTHTAARRKRHGSPRARTARSRRHRVSRRSRR